MARQMNHYRINVLGSCVTRVALLDGIIINQGIADDRMDIEYFLDKQNVVCAMYPPPFSREEVEGLVDIDVHEKYAIRSLKQNLNKDTLDMLMESDGDFVIVDFMDMHMAHAKYNDTYFATQALEFYRTNLGEKYEEKIEKVRFLELPTEEWLPRLDEFWEKMIEKYDENHIILNRFRSNTYYMSKEGVVREIPWNRFHGPSHPIPELNERLRELEEYVIHKYHPWVIDISKYFMGDENMWENLQGAHFEREFYRETFDYIKEIIFRDGSGNWSGVLHANSDTKYLSKVRFFEDDRRGLGEDVQYNLDMDNAFSTLEKFYNDKNLLWINILDKIYIHQDEDKRAEKYIAKYIDEAKGIL